MFAECFFDSDDIPPFILPDELQRPEDVLKKWESKKESSNVLAPLADYFFKTPNIFNAEKYRLIAHMLISLEKTPLQLEKKINAILSRPGFSLFIANEPNLVKALNEVKNKIHVMTALAPASSAASASSSSLSAGSMFASSSSSASANPGPAAPGQKGMNIRGQNK